MMQDKYSWLREELQELHEHVDGFEGSCRFVPELEAKIIQALESAELEGRIDLAKEYLSVAQTISTKTVHEQVFINDISTLESQLKNIKAKEANNG